jgi:hypothetical protein
MSLLDEALRAPKCVISVMGAHAGEDAAAIFSRKISDCREIGRTFWVVKSAKARPAQVQTICHASHGYVIIVEPATPGGARPTKEANSATAYSPDGATWVQLPSGIGPVTGQMDASATACAVQKNMSAHPNRMKSRYRRIVAVARLAEPYCVWVR